MRLNAKNNAETVLAADITASDTTITVEDANALPEVPFVMTLDKTEEIVLVTDKSGNTLTVERGYEDSIARDYAEGTIIYCNFTAGMYDVLADVDYVDGEINSVISDSKEYTNKQIESIDLSEFAMESALENHVESNVHESEVHGMRYTNGTFEVFDGSDWVEIKGGGGANFYLGNVSDFNAVAGNEEVVLTWTDPSDTILEGITLAEWAGTLIRRRKGSYPVDEKDGELVVDSKVRNQYETDGFTDDGLTNETEYFYMAFPYSTDGSYTVDSANRISATPADKDDTSGSPGPADLLAGDIQAGFFGEVPASEFVTGSEIASLCGISQGTLQNDDVPWLKYAYEGKICFRPKKSVRHSINWDTINNADCVYGDSDGKVVEIDGLSYRVRLMRGALTDPSKNKNDDSDRGAKGSEWNKIMLPISEKAIDQSWHYPQYVTETVPAWEHGFGSGAKGMYTDTDLGFVSGSGYFHWCQETTESSASSRVLRGNSNGPSNSSWNTSSNTNSARGWAPVLELIE